MIVVYIKRKESNSKNIRLEVKTARWNINSDAIITESSLHCKPVDEIA